MGHGTIIKNCLVREAVLLSGLEMDNLLLKKDFII